MKKLIRYRISIAEWLPATHPRKGQPTGFVGKILANKGCDKCLLKSELCDVTCSYSYLDSKIHTIRGNYEAWQKRFEKIDRGEAVIELYYWEGKPYNSKQVVFMTLGKDDGIGLQKLDCSDDYLYTVRIDDVRHSFSDKMIAENDGLTPKDFENWFKGADLSKPLAIIHFTDFRY